MAKDKRVEVLFEPGDYRLLEGVARRDGKSVGHVIREAVAKYVVRPTEEERQRAFEHFLGMEPVPVGSPEEEKKIIVDSQYIAILKSMNDPALDEEIKRLEDELAELIRDIEAR